MHGLCEPRGAHLAQPSLRARELALASRPDVVANLAGFQSWCQNGRRGGWGSRSCVFGRSRSLLDVLSALTSSSLPGRAMLTQPSRGGDGKWDNRAPHRAEQQQGSMLAAFKACDGAIINHGWGRRWAPRAQDWHKRPLPENIAQASERPLAMPTLTLSKSPRTIAGLSRHAGGDEHEVATGQALLEVVTCLV